MSSNPFTGNGKQYIKKKIMLVIINDPRMQLVHGTMLKSKGSLKDVKLYLTIFCWNVKQSQCSTE